MRDWNTVCLKKKGAIMLAQIYFCWHASYVEYSMSTFQSISGLGACGAISHTLRLPVVLPSSRTAIRWAPRRRAPIAAANSELQNGNAAAAPTQQLIEQTVAGRLDGAPPSQPVRVIVTNEVAVRSVVPPAELYRRVVDVGVYKGTQPWWKIAVGGVLAGVYTAFGGIWLLSVGPNCPGIAAANPGLAKLITGAVGLPIGLITIFTCGGDLFTGNTAVVTAALIEKKVTLRQLLKSWTVSYTANLVGCALGILLAHTAGLTPQLARGAIAYATYKTSAPLGVVLARAIGANWFVCLAVWQCTAAQTYLGKALACAMPLTAFITIGLEHSIANMFFVPLGILAGEQRGGEFEQGTRPWLACVMTKACISPHIPPHRC